MHFILCFRLGLPTLQPSESLTFSHSQEFRSLCLQVESKYPTLTLVQLHFLLAASLDVFRAITSLCEKVFVGAEKGVADRHSAVTSTALLDELYVAALTHRSLSTLPHTQQSSAVFQFLFTQSCAPMETFFSALFLCSPATSHSLPFAFDAALQQSLDGPYPITINHAFLPLVQQLSNHKTSDLPLDDRLLAALCTRPQHCPQFMSSCS